MTEIITKALEELALTINKTIEGGLSSGEFEPENEPAFRWRLEDFQYTDAGITQSRAHGEYLTKESWFRASLKVLERIKQTDSYLSSYEQMRQTFGNNVEYAGGLEAFARQVIHLCFYESPTTDVKINSLISSFLRELRGEPVKYGADAELDGIVMRPKTIEPEFGITLRQPRIEDLEEIRLIFPPMTPEPYVPHPSAYMRIEFLGRNASEIQLKVQHAITILRLFRVGSVKCQSYRMYSDSVMDMMTRGTLTTGRREPAREKYLITAEDTTKLKKFWQTIANLLPKIPFEFDQTKADHLTIAYARYSDALLQNGVIERRIANAIMGMESLYLGRSETQELAYRLGIRVGKLFHILGFDHHDVKKRLSDAYRIRNLFAHGSQLSYKEKRRLELKYKDLRNLLLTVLDYLRISILVTIVLKKDKDEFIDLLEDSLIDHQKEDLLNSWLSTAKEIIR